MSDACSCRCKFRVNELRIAVNVPPQPPTQLTRGLDPVSAFWKLLRLFYRLLNLFVTASNLLRGASGKILALSWMPRLGNATDCQLR